MTTANSNTQPVKKEKSPEKERREGIIRDYVIKIEAIDKKEFPGALGVFEANRLIDEMETALFPEK